MTRRLAASSFEPVTAVATGTAATGGTTDGWALRGWGATWRRGSTWLAAVLAAYITVYCVWFWTADLPDHLRALLSDAAYLPLNALALALAVRAATSRLLPDSSRVVWVWVVGAYASRAFGDVAWFWLEGVQQVEPFPSVADAGYLGFYPLMFVALLRVPALARVGRDRARLVCELLAVLGAGWMLLWSSVIGSAVSDLSAVDLGLILSVAYPLGDLALIAAVASVALRRAVPLARPMFVPLAMAMASFVAADTLFAVYSLDGSWVGGQLPDLFWLSALALTAWAPVRQLEAARADRPVDSTASGLSGVGTAGYTYAAVLVGGGLLWWSAWHVGGAPQWGLLLGMTAVLSGVLVRQVLAVGDVQRAGTALEEALQRNLGLTESLEETVARRTSELEARTRQLHEQAHRDPLTGLGNRARLQQRLSDRTEVSLLMVDLDGFKEVNDSLGHNAGDTLLVEVGQRLSAVADPHLVTRLGGDEFAVVVDAGLDAAEVLGHRLLDALQAPFQVGAAVLTVGASVGLAGGVDPTLLLRDADCAMYHAKRSGRNRLARYRSGMHAAVVERLTLQADLRAALGTGQLSLAYQPTVRLADGAWTGTEALLRWQHPQRGPIPPLHFIPLAEESGLIVPVGAWVLQEACRACAAWQALPGGLGVSVAVNVSLRQVSDPALLEVVASALAAAGLMPSLLTVEITESVLADDEQMVLDFLDGLHRLGVRVALDDFGTGHSSLSSLSRYPLDVLKIDKEFVDPVLHRPAAVDLLAAVTRIGHSLGLVVLAEGIEHPEQARVLAELGCEVGQGYDFSRPLTERDLLAALADRAALPRVTVPRQAVGA